MNKDFVICETENTKGESPVSRMMKFRVHYIYIYNICVRTYVCLYFSVEEYHQFMYFYRT